MPRVVIDTNVLVSAFMSPYGLPAKVFEYLQQKSFELLVSPSILSEYQEVLHRPKFRRSFGIAEARLEAFIATIRESSALVVPQVDIVVIAVDPDDDIFLECAVAGDAGFIVSGDRHLLALGSFEGIQIVTPAAFVSYLEEAIQ